MKRSKQAHEMIGILGVILSVTAGWWLARPAQQRDATTLRTVVAAGQLIVGALPSYAHCNGLRELERSGKQAKPHRKASRSES